MGEAAKMNHLIIENLAYVPTSIGIYRLYAIGKSGKPICIQRFGGVDKNGLLYIGQTSKQTLRKRIYNLLAASREIGKTTNHSGGKKYKTNPVIQKTLQEHFLYFDFEICQTPLSREADLLKEYSLEFGEYPPLNR